MWAGVEWGCVLVMRQQGPEGPNSLSCWHFSLPPRSHYVALQDLLVPLTPDLQPLPPPALQVSLPPDLQPHAPTALQVPLTYNWTGFV